MHENDSLFEGIHYSRSFVLNGGVTEWNQNAPVIFGFTLRDTKGKNLVQGGITGAVCVGRDGNDLNQVLAESKRFADGLAGLIDAASAHIFGIRPPGKVTECTPKPQAIRFLREGGQWTALDQSFITEESKKRKTVAS